MRNARPAGAVLGLVAALVLVAATACTGTKPPTEAGALAGFCADWFKLAAESSQLGAVPSGSVTQPEALRSSVEATTAYLKALADSAPAAIKPDFTTYAEWWADFSRHMARVNYDFSKVASDPELQQAMQATTEPKFTQASAKISAWVQQNCAAPR